MVLLKINTFFARDLKGKCQNSKSNPKKITIAFYENI